ncbi:hypothetical protein N9F34_03855 [Alphaproteobacteria bacterium]|nr:hypothetical protein [Alphaproteobacteria bacterium]
MDDVARTGSDFEVWEMLEMVRAATGAESQDMQVRKPEAVPHASLRITKYQKTKSQKQADYPL